VVVEEIHWNGGGGAGGGTAIEVIPFPSGTNVPVTIGRRCRRTCKRSGATGGTGGTSSFGPYCSATGGAGGVGGPAPVGSGQGGIGGSGSGGTVNFVGSDGAFSPAYILVVQLEVKEDQVLWVEVEEEIGIHFQDKQEITMAVVVAVVEVVIILVVVQVLQVL
jgi:hypothetical protein